MLSHTNHHKITIAEKQDSFFNRVLNTTIGITPPYKLHITIDKAQFGYHQTTLVTLLTRAIEDNTIGGFKYNKTDQLFNIIKENESNQQIIKEATRFLEGDQFTIYLMPNYDMEAIKKLCAAIEQVLSYTPAGKFAELDSPISPHISFRQDYFPIFQKNFPLEKAHLLCTRTIEYKYNRTLSAAELMGYIPASLPNQIASWPSYSKLTAVTTLKKFQEQHELYQYLTIKQQPEPTNTSSPTLSIKEKIDSILEILSENPDKLSAYQNACDAIDACFQACIPPIDEKKHSILEKLSLLTASVDKKRDEEIALLKNACITIIKTALAHGTPHGEIIDYLNHQSPINAIIDFSPGWKLGETTARYQVSQLLYPLTVQFMPH